MDGRELQELGDLGTKGSETEIKLKSGCNGDCGLYNATRLVGVGIGHVCDIPVEKLGQQRPSSKPPLLTCAFHSGWISALSALKINTAVTVLMLLVALLFTGIAVLGIVMLKRVRGCVGGWARRVRSWVPRGHSGTFKRILS